MTNPVFPVLADDQDSKYYSISSEDPAIKTQMDGGYVVSRPKHTRTPRRTYSTGYSNISNADRLAVQAFYDATHGGSVIFDWIDPVAKATHQVRFSGKLDFKYVGIGGFHRWDLSFSVEQA